MPWEQGGRFRGSLPCCQRARCSPDAVSAFLCFCLLSPDAESGKNHLQEEPVMGMAGLAAADVASLWAAGLWLPQEFPLFLPGES